MGIHFGRRNPCAGHLAAYTAQLILLLQLFSCSALASSTESAVGSTRSVHDLANGLSRFYDGMDSRDTRSNGCRICHTPRDRDRTNYGSGGIRWNEQANTGSTWPVYDSDPAMLNWIDGSVEPAPTGSSKVCLGCHDGLIAPNHSDGRSAGRSNSPPPANASSYRSSLNIGGTSAGLTNNHPISITYAWTRDSQLHDPVYAIMGDGNSVQALLEDGRVECATCHDVHMGDITSNQAMLRTNNSGANFDGSNNSGLCLVCHDK